MAIILQGGLIVTMNSKREVIRGDIKVEADRIVKVAAKISPLPADEVADVRGRLVIPGLIQAHTHLCQALFRGDADDLSLLNWLKKRIWPMESSHSPETLKASARIALLEMQLLGTTAIVDMGTVKHTDALLEEVAQSGIRYVGGKCLMDLKSAAGPLWEDRAQTIHETHRLIERWHKTNPLIDYALCPRFVISCSDQLLRECAGLQQKHGLILHTHASESKEEIAVVKKRTGKLNVEYLYDVGLLNERSVIVHGVHLTNSEIKRLFQAGATLVHCPSSNLKLASGIAPIAKYLQHGLKIAIGSDGAPCNNTMDPFLEMRLTALLQKPAFGPEALPARTAFELATLGGARALGRESELGSLEQGKLADLVVVAQDHPSTATVVDPYSALVYSTSGRDVLHVMTNGQWVVRDGKHWRWQKESTIEKARQARQSIMKKLSL